VLTFCNAREVLQKVSTTKSEFENVTDNRELLFDEVRELVTRIIEELMCHLDCDIGELLDQYNGIQESFGHELEALRPFTADGFVRIDGNRIVVEESGRPYLRLIASTFDAYLHNPHVRHSVAV